MNPQATAGRLVHYYEVHAGKQSRAAIVNVDTAEDGTAQLTVLASTGPSVHLHVPYSEEPAHGCWSWMPYQREKAATAEGNVSESAEPRPQPDPGSFEDFARRVFKDYNDRLVAVFNRVKALEVAADEPNKLSISHDSEAIHGGDPAAAPDISEPNKTPEPQPGRGGHMASMPEADQRPPDSRRILPELADGSAPSDSAPDGSP